MYFDSKTEYYLTNKHSSVKHGQKFFRVLDSNYKSVVWSKNFKHKFCYTADIIRGLHYPTNILDFLGVKHITKIIRDEHR
ncbi:hypothetical protein TKK_0019280 [Trichogramma kaykai]